MVLGRGPGCVIPFEYIILRHSGMTQSACSRGIATTAFDIVKRKISDATRVLFVLARAYVAGVRLSSSCGGAAAAALLASNKDRKAMGKAAMIARRPQYGRAFDRSAEF